MRKMFVFFSIFLSLGIFVGCSAGQSLQNCFSEITYDYYSGVGQDGTVVSISVGEREEPYSIDGRHGANVDFALVSVQFLERQTFNQMSVAIESGEVHGDLILEFNPLNNCYMGDLGRRVESEEILVIFNEKSIKLQKTSENFAINHQKAIEKAISALGSEIDKYYSNGNFEGECYLKILSEVDDNFEDLYWVFTIVGKRGESNNVVIDISNGMVILAN